MASPQRRVMVRLSGPEIRRRSRIVAVNMMEDVQLIVRAHVNVFTSLSNTQLMSG